MATKRTKSKKSRAQRNTWLNRTKLYGFELFMAAFGLTVAAIVIDYGFFAFFNSLVDESGSASGLSEASLFVVAAMLVWLPLATFFYLRARGEQVYDAKRTQATFTKVVTSILLFFNILLAAGAAFAAIYSLIQIATSEDGELLVRVTLPAILMTVLHAWLCFAFSQVRFASRAAFASSFVGVGIVVMIVLFAVSFGDVRSAALDEKRVADLEEISREMRDFYAANDRQLPDSLEDLKLEEINNDLDEYYYTKSTLGRYELCADFASDTKQEHGSDYTTADRPEHDRDDVYQSYAAFSQHEKGRDCFKLRIGTYSNYPYDRYND